MFKTAAQVNDVISLSKAFFYENTQRIATTLQTRVNPKQESDILLLDMQIQNLITAAQFIGSNNTDNNKIADKLQELIEPPVLMDGYVQDGYVENGYAKSNPE